VDGKHVQEEDDKERGWGCTRGVILEKRGRWREAKRRDDQVARGEDAELAHARCLTLARPLEHARVRSVGTIQRAGVIERLKEGYGRMVARWLGKMCLFRKMAIPMAV
jgi:hypothetical protein